MNKVSVYVQSTFLSSSSSMYQHSPYEQRGSTVEECSSHAQQGRRFKSRRSQNFDHWSLGTSNDLVLRNSQFMKITTTPFNLITTVIKLIWQKISSSQNKKRCQHFESIKSNSHSHH